MPSVVEFRPLRLLCILVFIVLFVASSPGLNAASPSSATMIPHTDPQTGLRFEFPSHFHLTHYAESPIVHPAQRPYLPFVLVLVEHTLHTSTPSTPVEIGSLPTISLDLLTGDRALFSQHFFRPEFRTRVGNRTVYELPAHDGPSHQQVFYYLVPLSNGRILEIAGHRHYFNDGRSSLSPPPTGYDDIIRRIIESLNRPGL